MKQIFSGLFHNSNRGSPDLESSVLPTELVLLLFQYVQYIPDLLLSIVISTIVSTVIEEIEIDKCRN